MSPPDSSHSLDPGALLDQSAWLRGLAGGLLRDDATAEDVAQEAWLASAGARIRHPRAWFGRVVRNLAHRHHRGEIRRREREKAVARPERRDEEASVLVERAELHSRLVARLLELDEPYRETLLLRYFEDLSPVEIASRSEIPEATVRTRLQRGLARLRTKLGERDPDWRQALVPIAGMSSTSAVPVAVATSATASPALTSTTLSVGALVMSQKIITASLVTTVIAGGLGLFIGNLTSSPELDPERAKTELNLVDADLLEEERSRTEALREELAEARQEQAERTRRIAELESEVASLVEEKAGEAEEEGTEVVEAGAARQARIKSGKFGDLEELEAADWKTLASAVGEIHSVFQQMREQAENGATDEDPELIKKVGLANSNLIPLAISLMGKIPTEGAPANGEFTHPVVMANMMQSLLENEGVPLSPKQIREVSQLIEEYDEQFPTVVQGGDENLPRISRVARELDMKFAFKQSFEEILDDRQYERIALPGVHNSLRDIFSGSPMVMGMMKPTVADTPDAVIQRVGDQFAENFGLGESQRAALEPALAEYREVAGKQMPRKKEIDTMSTARLVDLAEAQGKLFQAMQQLPDVSEESAEKIREFKGMVIPALSNDAAGSTDG